MLHVNGIQFDGDALEAQRIPVANLTGADTVVGGVYALDLGGENGASTTIAKRLTNIILVSAKNLAGILVVTDRIIKAGEEGLAVVSGPVKALVHTATDITDATKQRLKAVTARHDLSLVSEAAGSTDRCVAVALETDAVIDTLCTVLFDGEAFNKAINAATT